jgi:hypothetical protein
VRRKTIDSQDGNQKKHRAAPLTATVSREQAPHPSSASLRSLSRRIFICWQSCDMRSSFARSSITR